MPRYALFAVLLGAAPLGAQTTDVDARNRAILAAALREAPKDGDVRARFYSVKDDTVVVAVLQTILPRDSTPGETLVYFHTVVRRNGEWVSVGPRNATPMVLARPTYAPAKVLPPPPGNRVSRP